MDSIVNLTPAALGLVPLCIALTELVKIYVDSRWAPIASLALGIAGSFLIPAPTLALTVLQGLVVGLSASGLYSGGKSVVKG